MTETTPISNASSSQNKPVASTASDPSALASDFETFLKMLTAQARNQDPLEPINSSEYAAQLAQFSMVEQQVRTNETLSELSALLGGPQMSQLSGWIGSEVRALAPAYFDGDPVRVSPPQNDQADSAILVVRNGSGDIVDRQSLPVSHRTAIWNGLDSNGLPMAAGQYSFSVEHYRGVDLLSEESAATYNRVSEAQLERDDVILILEGGQAILAPLVTAVRSGDPQPL
ncbi:flagellar hook capping FlgD N-terminal domain-containing protein [Ruegeria sp. 2205SS24-7]|uniref:flagellar hook capping FlgD N-terminal domain-containing protein n=1 Tax=Ruegeria discodermiae TaxID=3064389 RepID=UPI002740CA31|nr:flagellar hook capping FlgD N-terminal domain-containing protein [Ruegeria sp. 2205SS24-7]MDP5218297.1 flagellar hook capping FlgD N-terminal domain-containing protein [Ruegeria sp. 2205SS24-7]